MSLNYQEVRQQVKELGENTALRESELRALRQIAHQLINNPDQDLESIRQKVLMAASTYDQSLRCALPSHQLNRPAEALNAHFPPPCIPEHLTILASDGSQIAPDRHAPVNYCLINVGTICLKHGSAAPPVVGSQSQLIYGDDLVTPAGTITDARLGLMRDLNERIALADLAEKVELPVVTFTDGPMELWGSRDGSDGEDFQQKLEAYLAALHRLHGLGVITAGYVDKPAAGLVVRMLEVMLTPIEQLPELREAQLLRGVTDFELYCSILEAGDRSAVFAIQSQSSRNYPGPLELHFFYLNVGRAGYPWLARVEIPAWVAGDLEMLDQLQATLVHQCQIMGSRPYPYLLHRAHEAARVSFEEKEQVTQMITIELRKRGLQVGEFSNKQAIKDLPGRTSYEG